MLSDILSTTAPALQKDKDGITAALAMLSNVAARSNAKGFSGEVAAVTSQVNGLPVFTNNDVDSSKSALDAIVNRIHEWREKFYYEFNTVQDIKASGKSAVKFILSSNYLF